jgi:hypothetical protein
MRSLASPRNRDGEPRCERDAVPVARDARRALDVTVEVVAVERTQDAVGGASVDVDEVEVTPVREAALG